MNGDPSPEQMQAEQQQREEEQRRQPKERTGAYQENDPNAYDPSKPIIEAAKDFFFIAEDAGNVVASSAENGQVHLLWEDGSVINVRFEARPGSMGAVGPRVLNDEARAQRNDLFQTAKKDREDLVARARDIKRSQQEQAVAAKEPESRL